MTYRKENDGNFFVVLQLKHQFLRVVIYLCVGHSAIEEEEKQLSEIILCVDQILELWTTNEQERKKKRRTERISNEENIVQNAIKTSNWPQSQPQIRFKANCSVFIENWTSFEICFEQRILTSWNFRSSFSLFLSLSLLSMTNWSSTIKTFLLIPSQQDSLPMHLNASVSLLLK